MAMDIEVLRALVAAGGTPEQMMAAIEEMLPLIGARKSSTTLDPLLAQVMRASGVTEPQIAKVREILARGSK